MSSALQHVAQSLDLALLPISLASTILSSFRSRRRRRGMAFYPLVCIGIFFAAAGATRPVDGSSRRGLLFASRVLELCGRFVASLSMTRLLRPTTYNEMSSTSVPSSFLPRFSSAVSVNQPWILPSPLVFPLLVIILVIASILSVVSTIPLVIMSIHPPLFLGPLFELFASLTLSIVLWSAFASVTTRTGGLLMASVQISSVTSYVYTLVAEIHYNQITLPARVEFGQELVTFFWILSFVVFYHIILSRADIILSTFPPTPTSALQGYHASFLNASSFDISPPPEIFSPGNKRWAAGGPLTRFLRPVPVRHASRSGSSSPPRSGKELPRSPQSLPRGLKGFKLNPNAPNTYIVSSGPSRAGGWERRKTGVGTGMGMGRKFGVGSKDILVSEAMDPAGENVGDGGHGGRDEREDFVLGMGDYGPSADTDFALQFQFGSVPGASAANGGIKPYKSTGSLGADVSRANETKSHRRSLALAGAASSSSITITRHTGNLSSPSSIKTKIEASPLKGPREGGDDSLGLDTMINKASLSPDASDKPDTCIDTHSHGEQEVNIPLPRRAILPTSPSDDFLVSLNGDPFASTSVPGTPITTVSHIPPIPPPFPVPFTRMSSSKSMINPSHASSSNPTNARPIISAENGAANAKVRRPSAASVTGSLLSGSASPSMRKLIRKSTPPAPGGPPPSGDLPLPPQDLSQVQTQVLIHPFAQSPGSDTAGSGDGDGRERKVATFSLCRGGSTSSSGTGTSEILPRPSMDSVIGSSTPSDLLAPPASQGTTGTTAEDDSLKLQSQPGESTEPVMKDPASRRSRSFSLRRVWSSNSQHRRSMSSTSPRSTRTGFRVSADQHREDVSFLEALVRNSFDGDYQVQSQFGESPSKSHVEPATSFLASGVGDEDVLVIQRSANVIAEEHLEGEDGMDIVSRSATPTLQSVQHSARTASTSSSPLSASPANRRMSRQLPPPLDLTFSKMKIEQPRFSAVEQRGQSGHDSRVQAEDDADSQTPQPAIIALNTEFLGRADEALRSTVARGQREPQADGHLDSAGHLPVDGDPQTFTTAHLNSVATSSDGGHTDYYSAMPSPTTPFSPLSTSSVDTSDTFSPMLITPPAMHGSLFGPSAPVSCRPPHKSFPIDEDVEVPVEVHSGGQFGSPILSLTASGMTSNLHPQSQTLLIGNEGEVSNPKTILKLFRSKSRSRNKELTKSVASFSSQKRADTSYSHASDAAFEMQEFGVRSPDGEDRSIRRQSVLVNAYGTPSSKMPLNLDFVFDDLGLSFESERPAIAE